MNQDHRKHPRGPAIVLVLLSDCSTPSSLSAQTRTEADLDLWTSQPGQTTASLPTHLRSFTVRTYEPSPAPPITQPRWMCDAGYAPSCNGLGVLFAEGRGTAKDAAQAAQLYQTSCEAGASTGCEQCVSR